MSQPNPKTQPKPNPNLYQNRLSFCYPNNQRFGIAVSSLGAGLSLPVHAFEYVVVDDGSPPPLQEKLAKALRPFNGRLLRWKKNTGFAHAVNSGAAVARGRYLCLVNNDLVFPRKPWLAAMLKEIEKPGGVAPACFIPGTRNTPALFIPRTRRFDHEYRHQPGITAGAGDDGGPWGHRRLAAGGERFLNKLLMDEQSFFPGRMWISPCGPGRRATGGLRSPCRSPRRIDQGERKAASWAFWHRMDRDPRRVLRNGVATAGWPDLRAAGKPACRLQAAYWRQVLEGKNGEGV